MGVFLPVIEIPDPEILGTAKCVERACYRVCGDTVYVSLCFIRTIYSTKKNAVYTLMTDD